MSKQHNNYNNYVLFNTRVIKMDKSYIFLNLKYVAFPDLVRNDKLHYEK